MAYTYSTTLADDVSKARLFAADTDVSDGGANASFTDEELAYFLSISSNVPAMAAAYALDALAADSARLSYLVKTGPVTVDARTLADALAKRAETLRGIAAGLIPEDVLLPPGSVPDRIFSTDADEGQVVGTMTGW